jgi:RNA polymerase-binding transcription factor DksA
MAQIDQQQVREQLMAERSRLERDIFERTQGDQAIAPVDPLLVDAGGVSSHQADNADAVSDFERNQAIIANSRLVLKQVQAALARLDNGAYGVCERCGKPIEPRRLAALPYATLCRDCQEATEREGGSRR